MSENCQLARQRVSLGGLTNEDDREALLAMSSDIALGKGRFGKFGVGPYGMEDAFRDWAEKHPELRNLPALVGVVDALREKWPCIVR